MYLPRLTKDGSWDMTMEMDCSTSNHPTVDEIGLTGQRKLSSDIYLNGTIGIARVENTNYTNYTDHDNFVTASVKWMY